MSDPNQSNPMDPVDTSPPDSDLTSNAHDDSATHLAAKQKYRRSRRRRYADVYIFLAFVVLAFVITVAIYQSVQSKRSQAPEEKQRKKEKYLSQTKNSNDSTAKHGNDQTANHSLLAELPFSDARLNKVASKDSSRASNSQTSKNNADSEKASVSPLRRIRFHRVLREAKKQIAERSFESAERLINEARELAGASIEQQIHVEGVDVLLDYAQQFWEAFDEGYSTLEGNEIQVEGERMYIVACDENQIVIRRRGKNETLRRESLSSRMTMLIAERGFDNSAPSTKVFKGVFMLISPDYTDEQVRSLWQEAADAGTDVSNLLPLLAR